MLKTIRFYSWIVLLALLSCCNKPPEQEIQNIREELDSAIMESVSLSYPNDYYLLQDSVYLYIFYPVFDNCN